MPMRTLPILAFAALLVGCGGGGGDTSFIEGTAGSVSVSFAGGTDYNGGTAALASYTTLNGSAANKVIAIYASNNDRGVEASLVATSAKTGATVDLANANNGSTVVYSDTVGKWSSSSGTITVTARTSASVQITLTNVVLTNVSSTNAKGTVTLNGTMSFTAT